VIGARGTGGLGRFMLGGVAAKLSHHAPSSLLIVRDD
jgi:nucleotide-binding universal stress UspA family protein